MWRFILVSFAFLGWSFYELSGGADYRPSANSIQARALLDNHRPQARPLRVNVIELAQDGTPRQDAEVTRTITSLHDLGLSMGDKVVLTLASAEGDAIPDPISLNLPTVRVATPTALPDTPEVAQPVQAVALDGETLAAASDLRRVSGNSVNLRTGPGTGFGRVASLKRGTEVIVLRDPGEGWIKLRVVETGRIGWMAETLLTLASD
ncbi:SH3 domain-containing protein [Roseovarius mucosus]|uniref:Bacterial SH3 domain protein n=1 Tax=Roseovarius mucosus TaxID=215743 RepID=A0A1V0RSU2_9RHOB|nr:SH3 domain-containing protein [Roseovarius mucosus]ARE84715.1 bacterial SH3 domain protein [Roseovarius mucosus]MBW4974000.1 SH3 domain-containing protein [Roseovarius mucosus]